MELRKKTWSVLTSELIPLTGITVLWFAAIISGSTNRFTIGLIASTALLTFVFIPRSLINNPVFRVNSFYYGRPINQISLLYYKVFSLLAFPFVFVLSHLFEGFFQTSPNVIFLPFLTTIPYCFATLAIAITLALLSKNLTNYYTMLIVIGLLLFAALMSSKEIFSQLEIKTEFAIQSGVYLHSSLKRFHLLRIIFWLMNSLLAIIAAGIVLKDAARMTLPQKKLSGCLLIFLLSYSFSRFLTHQLIPIVSPLSTLELKLSSAFACLQSTQGAFGNGTTVHTKVSSNIELISANREFVPVALHIKSVRRNTLSQSSSNIDNPLGCLNDKYLPEWLSLHELINAPSPNLQCLLTRINFSFPNEQKHLRLYDGAITSTIGLFQPFVDYELDLRIRRPNQDIPSGKNAIGGDWNVSVFQSELNSTERTLTIDDKFTPGAKTLLSSVSEYYFQPEIPPVVSPRYVFIHKQSGKLRIFPEHQTQLFPTNEDDIPRSSRNAFLVTTTDPILNLEEYRLLRISFRPVATQEVETPFASQPLHWVR